MRISPNTIKYNSKEGVVKFRNSILLAMVFYGLASATAMGDLAAQMGAHEWRELTTINVAPVIRGPAGSSNDCIFNYSNNGVWDPGTESFYFAGSDHQISGSGYGKFIKYSAANNTWSELPRPGWFPSLTSTAMHAYDHNAINVASGYFYTLGYCCSPALERYNIKTATWTALASAGYYQGAGGLEHFPELGGLVFALSGTIRFFNESTSAWSTLGSASMGGEHGYAQYNPIHKVVICGGGDGNRSVTRVNASRQVTAMAAAPSDVGQIRPNYGFVTLDPVSGDYLVFGGGIGAGVFYVYDVIANTWTKQSQTVPFLNGDLNSATFLTVAAPVSTYGVVMFVKYVSSTQGKVYLYKHTVSGNVVEGAAGKAGHNIDLKISPNPVQSNFTVNLPANAGQGRISLYTAGGQMVRTFEIKDSQSATAIQGLQHGVYILKVDTRNLKTAKRLVVL